MPEIPRLADGVVTLRAAVEADVTGIVEQSADPDTQRWTTVPREYDETSAREFLAYVEAEWANTTGNRIWAIERDVLGAARFVGLLDLRFETTVSAEVGFVLHPAHRSDGVMSDALRLLARHCFTVGPWGVPLRRIHWQAEVGNWASRRVAWACGFTFHGTLPDMLRHWNDAGQVDAADAWTGSVGANDVLEPGEPWFEPEELDAETASGAKLRLRPWRDDDAPWRQNGFPALGGSSTAPGQPAHWMPERAILTEETFPSWLLNRRERMSIGQTVEWCIADGATDCALGSVSLFSRDGVISETAELGYQLVPHARGRGIATAAARRIVTHARASRGVDGLDLRRLVAQTAVDNVASNAVLRHLGFMVFGREPAVDLLPDGTFADGLHWHLPLH